MSIIKVRDQNLQNYSRMRENVESEFEFIGHPLSNDGFKKSVSRCMKDERSCLYKLYMTRPECGCPQRATGSMGETQDVLELFEFHKDKKCGVDENTNRNITK